mgnify:CR=1 FL=1
MSNQTKQVVITTRATPDPSLTSEVTAFFDALGAAVDITPQTGANLPFAPVTTATAIGTAAKTTTAALPAANTIVPVKFTNGNSAASITLAFATGGAKTVHLAGAAPSGAETTIAADGVALFWFDGTILHQMGVYA